MEIWRKYNSALIPNVSPHFAITNSTSEIKQLIKKQAVFFARWTSEFDKKEQTQFWYVINDSTLNIEDYSANTRSKIRRGLKNLDLKKITRTEVLNNGYPVYKMSFNRYKSFQKPLNKSDFISYISNLDGNREFWGIYLKETNILVAYSQNKIYDTCCDYDEIRFIPKYLKLYPSYVLFYTMNQYYLNKRKLQYVNDGARSIAHNTEIQNFLIEKFKFRKAYCNLHIVYSFGLSISINILYIFRRLIALVNIDVFQKFSVLLDQEHIKRSFEKR